VGVVIKQSFWGTFIAYFGVIIGYVNTLYLRPQFFSLDEIGLFTLVTANAMMISPLTSVGMSGTFIKFYPLLKDSKRLINQFFTFQLSLIILTNAVIVLIALWNRDWITEMISKGSSDYANYLAITAIIVIVNSLFDQLYAYCSSVLKVIFPAFLREVFLRFGAIVLVLGYAGGYFGFDWAVQGLAINYAIVLVLLFAHLIIFNKLRFDFSFSLIDKKWRRRVFDFSIYSMSLAVSFAIFNNASYTQVSSMLGDASNGIFVTCFFIGVIVEMPRRNMARIISPILSETMASSNVKETELIYKKSSITMSVIGLLIFIGIMTNLEDLFSFIPKGDEFSEGYWVVLSVCGAKLVMMFSSFAGEIIGYSKFYKTNLVLQWLSAIVLIILNYFLLPKYGLNGVAFSYFVAVLFHSVTKYWFVLRRFHIHPFMKSHLALIGISVLLFVAFYLFDTSLSPVITIILRSTLTTIVFTILIYKMKISTDINKLVDLLISKLKTTK